MQNMILPGTIILPTPCMGRYHVCRINKKCMLEAAVSSMLGAQNSQCKY